MTQGLQSDSPSLPTGACSPQPADKHHGQLLANLQGTTPLPPLPEAGQGPRWPDFCDAGSVPRAPSLASTFLSWPRPRPPCCWTPGASPRPPEMPTSPPPTEAGASPRCPASAPSPAPSSGEVTPQLMYGHPLVLSRKQDGANLLTFASQLRWTAGAPGDLPVASPSTAIPFPEDRRQVAPSPREASGSRAGHAETPSLGQENGRGGAPWGPLGLFPVPAHGASIRANV